MVVLVFREVVASNYEFFVALRALNVFSSRRSCEIWVDAVVIC